MSSRYLFVPETKGLALEQIDLLYRESSSMHSHLSHFESCSYIHHTVLGSEAYRKKIIAEGETFTRNHVAEKEVCVIPFFFL